MGNHPFDTPLGKRKSTRSDADDNYEVVLTRSEWELTQSTSRQATTKTVHKPVTPAWEALQNHKARTHNVNVNVKKSKALTPSSSEKRKIILGKKSRGINQSKEQKKVKDGTFVAMNVKTVEPKNSAPGTKFGKSAPKMAKETVLSETKPSTSHNNNEDLSKGSIASKQPIRRQRTKGTDLKVAKTSKTKSDKAKAALKNNSKGILSNILKQLKRKNK